MPSVSPPAGGSSGTATRSRPSTQAPQPLAQRMYPSRRAGPRAAPAAAGPGAPWAVPGRGPPRRAGRAAGRRAWAGSRGGHRPPASAPPAGSRRTGAAVPERRTPASGVPAAARGHHRGARLGRQDEVGRSRHDRPLSHAGILSIWSDGRPVRGRRGGRSGDGDDEDRDGPPMRSASTDSASSSYSVVSSPVAIRTSRPAASSSATCSCRAGSPHQARSTAGTSGTVSATGTRAPGGEAPGLGPRVETVGDPAGAVAQPPQGEGQGGRPVGPEGYSDAPSAAGAVRGDMAQELVVHAHSPVASFACRRPRFRCGRCAVRDRNLAGSDVRTDEYVHC